MATRMDDLAKHFDPDLYLPIHGRIYRIAAPTIAEADRVRPKLWGPQADSFSPADEWDECVKILGAAYLLMVEDGVSAPFVAHAGRTALIHFCSGPQGAELGRGHWQFAHLADRIDVDALMAELQRQANTRAARESMEKAAS